MLCLSGCVSADMDVPCGVNSFGYRGTAGLIIAGSECQVPHPVVSDAKVCLERCIVIVEWEGWRGAALDLPPASCSSFPSTAVHVELGNESGARSVLVVWSDALAETMVAGRVQREVVGEWGYDGVSTAQIASFAPVNTLPPSALGVAGGDRGCG